MKYLPLILAALLLVSARPLPTPPALPPATIHVPACPAIVVLQPDPTPAVTIAGTVEGRTSGGSPAPLGIYTAYGATIGEATQHAEQLEQQIRMEATAQHVVAP